mmetsp:Transcript_65308/g.75084  ORF Transcript_65308/g.75084 Transcript_65308/m.75084 type:complete len:369 (+) Transcript_65308:223-1329(+)
MYRDVAAIAHFDRSCTRKKRVTTLKRGKGFQDYPTIREKPEPRRASLYPSPPNREMNLQLMDSCLDGSNDRNSSNETSRSRPQRLEGSLTCRSSSFKPFKFTPSAPGSVVHSRKGSKSGTQIQNSQTRSPRNFVRGGRSGVSNTTKTCQESLAELHLDRQSIVKPKDLSPEDRTIVRKRVRQRTSKFHTRMEERYKAIEVGLNDQGFLSRNANAVRMETMKSVQKTRYKKNILPHVFQGEIQELLQDKATLNPLDSASMNLVIDQESLIFSPSSRSGTRSRTFRKKRTIIPSNSMGISRRASMSPGSGGEDLRSKLQDIITNPFMVKEKIRNYQARDPNSPTRTNLSQDARVVSIKNFERISRRMFGQ